MMTHRVGGAGATVFNTKGEPIARLQPGHIVVDGTIESARMPAKDDPKRLRAPHDKMVRPGQYEDKAL